MKMLKVLLALMLIGVSVTATSCIFKSDSTATPDTQIATVQRGNIRVDITATGNLALSEKEELAFEVGGTQQAPLSVEEVLVEEGDVVKKEQVLAKLDTSAWQDHLETLENALTTAQRQQTAKERALTAAQRQLETKENALTVAKRQVATKELALRQAELNVQTAEYNLEQIAEIKTAQDEVDAAELNLKMVQEFVSGTMGSPGVWLVTLKYAKERLTQAQNELKDILAEKSVKVTTEVALDIATKELAVEQAQKQVDDAQTAINDAWTAVTDAQNTVEDAKNAVPDARTAVEDAKKAVKDAQGTLDEELAKKTEIISPFDGFIISVNVEGGDAINKGQVACVIADPNKFESYVMVSEMDISKVKIDGNATVQVDSLQGLSFPAKVTHIAPTATVQSGVVNFRVKVELQSLQPIRQGQTTPGSTTGETPSGLQQAIEQGRITPEQAEQFRQQRAAQGDSSQGGSSSTATATTSIQLREGLTVTVNILVDEKNSVLVVPNKAITTEGRQAYVQVMSADGKVEKRAITKGISDWQYTEVTQGLSDGEQVVVPKSTTTSSTTSTSQQRPQGPMFIPGLGR